MTATVLADPRAWPENAGLREPPAPGGSEPRWRVLTAVLTALLLSAAAELPVLRIFGTLGLRLIYLVVPAAVVAAAAGRAGRRSRHRS